MKLQIKLEEMQHAFIYPQYMDSFYKVTATAVINTSLSGKSSSKEVYGNQYMYIVVPVCILCIFVCVLLALGNVLLTYYTFLHLVFRNSFMYLICFTVVCFCYTFNRDRDVVVFCIVC